MTTEKKADDRVYASVDEIFASGVTETEYAEIEGFTPGMLLRIGSVTAGDIIVWQEANETEAKRTAGLRLIGKSLVGPAPGNVRYADDPKHIAMFRAMRTNVTERILKAILKLNGMTVKNPVEDAKKD